MSEKCNRPGALIFFFSSSHFTDIMSTSFLSLSLSVAGSYNFEMPVPHPILAMISHLENKGGGDVEASSPMSPRTEHLQLASLPSFFFSF